MIKAENLTKRFEDITAVDHISAEIKEGCVFGLIGTNGSGKSTFLRMASGILKPDEGSITIDGEFWFGDYLYHRCLTCGVALLAGAGYLLVCGYSIQKAGTLFLLVCYKVIDGFADVFESEFQRAGHLHLTGKSNTFRT